MGEKNLSFFINCYLLQHSTFCTLIYDSIVELNINQDIYIYIYIYTQILTVISPTDTVSVQNAVNDAIHPHTAVHNNSRLL